MSIFNNPAIKYNYEKGNGVTLSSFNEPTVSLEEFRELETKLKEKEDFIKRTFEDWADDDIKIEQLVEPIIGKEFIDGDSYCVSGTVWCVEELVKKYNELKLEKDSLWLKTQEDERIINDLRDAVDEKKAQRDKAIEVATIIQGAYLRIGGADAPFHKDPVIQQSFKDLAELKGMKYFGLEVS